MKSILLVAFAFLISYSAFAVIGPITGYTSLCTGSMTTLSDTTAGGTWTSSNPAIASIGASTGIVTGIGAGVVTITYAVGTGSVTASVTVNATPGPIFACNNIGVGDTLPLTIGMGCSLIGVSGYYYSLTGFSVATLTMSGYVIGVAPGSATLSIANMAGCMTNFNFTVTSTRLISRITGNLTRCVGQNDTIADATSGGTWSSSYPPVATIGTTTEVFTLSGGSNLLVTYSMPGGTASCNAYVTPNQNPDPITGPTTVCLGDTITLNSNNSIYDCSDVLLGMFTSSAPLVAHLPGISGGTTLVSGLSSGTAIITYTDNNTGCFATHLITVGYPNAGAITGYDSVCLDSTLILSDSVLGGLWSVTNAASTISSSGTLIGVSTGIDTIKYSVTNACGTSVAEKYVHILNCALNVNSMTNDQPEGIYFYPNPTNGKINMECYNVPTGKVELLLTNTVGQIVYKSLLSTASLDGRSEINLPQLVNGVYFISLKGDGVNYFDKVLIRK